MDFTSNEIDTLRRLYLRDLYVGPPQNEALSHYNRATKKQFISDDDLNSLKARVEADKSEELNELLVYKVVERVSHGDTSEVAAEKAAQIKSEAIFRLVRAEVLWLMISDPGFIGSISDEKQRSAMFKLWQEQIADDKAFLKRRTGAYNSVPLHIF